MKLARRKRKDFLIPMTSFGDIAFLLIIFFMVASVFMKEAHIKVTQAASPDVDKAKGHVSVVMDTEGEVWLQGHSCPLSSLESAVAAIIQDKSDKSVTVKIDRDLAQEKFGQVLAALAEAGADIVMLGEREVE